MNRFDSRRSFLNLIAAGAAAASSARAAEPASDDYWQVVRSQFFFREDRVPMNAANLCPTPAPVAGRVEELTRDVDVDCSFQNRDKFAALLDQTRSTVAAQVGANADEIALVRNTSEANNTISNGIPLSEGDEIVIWDENHPTNNVAWDVRAARYGYKISRVKTPAAPTGVDELVGAFEKAISPRTRVLSVTHVSSLSGIKLPVQALTEMAHRRGIFVHVDGAQSLGVIDVDLRAIGCDSYSSSAHKWWVGPKEVGVLYVKADRVKDIWPSVVAPGWGDTVNTTLKGARKFESLGQRDDAAVAAMETTADFHALIGAARIEARVTELATQLKTGLRAMGATLVTPLAPSISSGICVIAVPQNTRQKLVDALYETYGIAGSPSGGLRLCPHLYNTRAHVQRAIDGVSALKSLIA